MNVRKQCWAWVIATLCAPGFVLADEQEQPAAPAAADVLLLKVAPQDGGGIPLKDLAGTVTIVTDEQPTQIQIGIDGQLDKKLAEAEHAGQGKYWIGLMCDVPSNALRSQLNLGAEEGLLVDTVYDGGPAKNAGFQATDVLIAVTIPGKAEIRPLKNAMDLNKAVQIAETAPLKVEFYRAGRKQTLEVVPAERPKSTTARINLVNADPKLHAIWGASTPESVGLRWAGPMVFVTKADSLPEGMTIEFQPPEGQPEKVLVKKGDQVWTSEVKSLDKLPDEIAGLVNQQLQQRTGRYTRTFGYQANAGNVNFVAHAVAPVLPDDVTITTVRKGAAPMKVTIQKGDQTWDVTEKDLGKVPVELRPFAAMALHGGGPHGPVPFTKVVTMPAAPVVPPVHVVEPRPVTTAAPVGPTVRSIQTIRAAAQQTQSQQEMERQLKELAEQVEKLRQAVEKTQPKQ